MPTAIPSAKSLQVGATPRWTLSTRISGLSTRKTPMPTSTTWVARSATASTRLSLADSCEPRMLRKARAAIRTAPPTMSPGASPSGSQKTAR